MPYLDEEFELCQKCLRHLHLDQLCYYLFSILYRGGAHLLHPVAKENFEIILDNIILENASNNKTYWKIMKMLLKSKKESG
jgi:hypothetical protein